MDRFQELEADITRQTITVNPAEAELLDALFTPFVSGFDALMPEMKVEELRIETTQLLALAFNALRWSQQQILAGYYAPGITMARSAWECWLNGMYLNLYPEDLRSWKVYETRPKPFAMRKLVAERMEPDDDSERKAVLQAMNDLYQGKKGDRFSGYSVFSHPTWEAIRILVADDGAGLTLRIGPAYDKALLLMAVDLFCTAGLFAASLFGYLLAQDQMDSVTQGLVDFKRKVYEWRASVLPK